MKQQLAGRGETKKNQMRIKLAYIQDTMNYYAILFLFDILPQNLKVMLLGFYKNINRYVSNFSKIV